MSEYLKPIEEKYGVHQGLNANWCAMAWPVSDDLWILDDESPEETVSLVRRVEREAEGDAEIVEILTGLPVSCILVQVPGFVNRSRFLDTYTALLTMDIQRSPESYRYGLANVPERASAMVEGLRCGSSSNTGRICKATCKALGIKPTYREIEIFLEGSAR